jgi:hypothetical protein
MYLVQISPDKEILYHTVDEFRLAIRRGEVGSESKIFHRSSTTWVPITVHPIYKKVVAEGLEPLRPLKRKRWTFFEADDADSAKAALSSEAAAAETNAEPFPIVPEQKKRNLGQLFRGAMRRLRKPGIA